MSASRAERLLAELEPLTHVGRLKRMIDVGRLARGGDADTRATLAALSSHEDTWPRLLALLAVHGSEDGAAVLRALEDRSRAVRSTASRMVARYADDAQAEAALRLLPGRRLRRRTAAALRARRRSGPVDRFCSTATVAQGLELLPFGSPEPLPTRLDELDEQGDPTTWARLATFHPGVAATLAERSLGVDLDERARHRIRTVLPALARRDPAAALRVLRGLLTRDDDLRSLPIQETAIELARRAPLETFDLLRRLQERSAPAETPGPFAGVRFDRAAHLLGAERLRYLVGHAWSTLDDGWHAGRWFLRLAEADRAALVDAWLDRGPRLPGASLWGAFLLRHVPPDGARGRDREDAYERWSVASRDADGIIAVGRLDALPRDLRQREARRHLALDALRSRSAQRVGYARLLSFVEAKETLGPWLSHPDGAERGRALATLVETVRHEPTALAAALDVVSARRFEQDPVRREMLDALSRLPLSRYRAEHLPALATVLRQALEASDLSPATSAAIERLAVRLFRLEASWAATWLSKVLEVRGSLSYADLGTQLSRAEVVALAPTLSELARTWSTRERAGALIWLARGLNRRLAHVPAVLDALERLAREMPFVGVAESALELLAEHARDRFRRLVPALLAEDPSVVFVGCVARFLSVSRQDLLDPFLGDRSVAGRFTSHRQLSARVHYVLDFQSGHGRWTPRQQRVHAEAWARVTTSAKQSLSSQASGVRNVARLSFAPPGVLLSLASDANPVVRDLALRALSGLDGGEGIPVLLDALADERARIAIYALRKAFLERPEPEVLSHLRAAPRTKVTVAKEIVRLLGELSGEDAFRELLAFDRPDVHRDVALALQRALWDHLERPETWGFLERAAIAPDWVVAAKVAEIPALRLSSRADDRLCGLLARVLEHPAAEARSALLARLPNLPVRDRHGELWAACLAHVQGARPEEAGATLTALLGRARATDVAPLGDLLRRLVSDRRVLVSLQSALEQRLGPYSRPETRAVALALRDALEADPLTAAQAVALTGSLRSARELGDLLSRLAGRGLLQADALLAAFQAAARCPEPDALESALALSDDAALRRVALETLVRSSSAKEGWTRARRERLERFRSDSSPVVAGAAVFVFPDP